MHYYGDTRRWRSTLHGNRALIGVALSVAVLALLVTAGCAPSGPTWVDSGASYTTKSVSRVLEEADISKLADTSAADSTKLRHDALTSLRRRGGNASAAADLITKTLPANTRGVPVYVERASMNGQPAYLLVEAIGPEKGKLTMKRLWVLSTAGAVLFVGTR
jgi:hypothetical protein